MLPLNSPNGKQKAPEAFELARAFCATQDVDQLLSQISGAVENLTGSEAASILLLDADKRQLVFRVATGERGASVKKFYVPVGKGVAGWVAEHAETVVVNDVQADQRFTGQIDKSSGFSTRSILAVPLKADGEIIGVCEALNKIDGSYSDDDRRVLENLASLAAATIVNARESEDNRNFFARAVEIFVTATEGSDTRLTGHSYRVAEMACRMGRRLGIEGAAYRDLYYAALLHDIGNLALHDLRYLPQVLAYTVERTPEKLHPLVGYELLKDIRLFARIAPIVRHHHERFDGTGHPDGRVGEDIPLASRILALLEDLEDLHIRGFMGEEFHKRAEEILVEGVGTRYDPAVVAAYRSINNEIHRRRPPEL